MSNLKPDYEPTPEQIESICEQIRRDRVILYKYEKKGFRLGDIRICKVTKYHSIIREFNKF